MMTIIELLNRLAEIAPGVCQILHYSDGDIFKIGGYKFFADYQNSFNAKIGSSTYTRGRPALAWLRDAIEAAIEARGWEYRVELSQGLFFIQVWNRIGGVVPSANFSAADKTEALLAAFVAAVEEQ